MEMFIIKSVVVFILFHLLVGVRGFCDEPDIPANSVIKEESHNGYNNRYDEGSYIDYRCETGYAMNGIIRIKCQHGKWTKAEFQCIDAGDISTFTSESLSIAMNKILFDKKKVDNNASSVGDIQEATIKVGNSRGNDVYFLIDISKSITKEKAELLGKFLKALFPKIGISNKPNGTRLAFYLFAGELFTQRHDHYNYENKIFRDYEQAQKFIDNMFVVDVLNKVQKEVGKGTAISTALLDVGVDIVSKKISFAKGHFARNAKQVVIIISDGRYNKDEKPTDIAENLKKKPYFAEIFSILLGADKLNRNKAYNTMKDMASNIEDEEHFFPIKEGQLKEVIKNMIENDCVIEESKVYKYTDKNGDEISKIRNGDSVYVDCLNPNIYYYDYYDNYDDSHYIYCKNGTLTPVNLTCDDTTVPYESCSDLILQNGVIISEAQIDKYTIACNQGFHLNVRSEVPCTCVNQTITCAGEIPVCLEGTDKKLVVLCPEACVRNGGRCDDPDVCVCPSGSSGKNCEIKGTDKKLVVLCPEACVRNGGRCDDPDVCVCPSGSSGKNCEIKGSNLRYVIDIQLSTQWLSATKDDVYIELVGMNGKRDQFKMYKAGKGELSEINYYGKDVTPIDYVVISKKTKYVVDDNMLIDHVSISVPEHDDYYVFKDQHPGNNWLKSDTPRTFTISAHPEHCVHTYGQALNRAPIRRASGGFWISERGCKQACVKEERFRCASVYVLPNPRSGRVYCTLYSDSASSNQFRDSNRVETHRKYKSYNRICRQK